jgi:hypothetical protein
MRPVSFLLLSFGISPCEATLSHLESSRLRDFKMDSAFLPAEIIRGIPFFFGISWP